MEIDENGVVNPLRVPSPIRAVAASIMSLPRLGRLFLVLAAIDFLVAVLRWRGLPWFEIGDALIVLTPVAVVWRRRGSAAATQTILRGTVLIAAAALTRSAMVAAEAWLPVRSGDPEQLGLDVPHIVSGFAILLTSAAGWLLVAQGIGQLRPARQAAYRAAGIVVALCVIATAVATVALYLVPPSIAAAPAILLGLANLAPWLVTAYLVSVVVSRAGSAPRFATWCAAAACVIMAAGLLPSVVIEVVAFTTHDTSLLSVQSVSLDILVVAGVLAPLLFVVAFASGLADPHGERQASAS